MQSWDLVDGRRVSNLGFGNLRSGEEVAVTYETSITPEEINLYRSGNYVDMLSTERINQLLDRPKSYGTMSLLRVKHWRFTQPLMNVILLLLAIPCVLTREPGKLKAGATKCLILMAAGMGSTFLTQQLASNVPSSMMADHWAALMAWVPIFLFGPLVVYSCSSHQDVSLCRGHAEVLLSGLVRNRNQRQIHHGKHGGTRGAQSEHKAMDLVCVFELEYRVASNAPPWFRDSVVKNLRERRRKCRKSMKDLAKSAKRPQYLARMSVFLFGTLRLSVRGSFRPDRPIMLRYPAPQR